MRKFESERKPMVKRERMEWETKFEMRYTRKCFEIEKLFGSKTIKRRACKE